MKMPLGETLEGAFSFFFGNILSVLGIVWLPYAAGVAVIGGALYLLHPDWSVLASSQAHFDTSAFINEFQRVANIFMLVWLVFLIVSTMVEVGLMRKALGLTEGPVFAYFSLGAPVWRLLGANVLVFFISAGILIAAIAAGVAIGSLAHLKIPGPWEVLIDVVAVIALIVGYIYAGVRFTFFLSAVVVAEQRIGIGRAWELGRSNVLRGIAVVLAITLLVGFVSSMLSSAVMPFAFPFGKLGANPDAQQMAQFQATFWRSAGPIFLGSWVLQSIVQSALLTGARAVAYKAVTGGGAQ